jgi:hypothetical protein
LCKIAQKQAFCCKKASQRQTIKKARDLLLFATIPASRVRHANRLQIEYGVGTRAPLRNRRPQKKDRNPAR